MADAIDNLQRVRSKLEKDRGEMKMEMEDITSNVETILKSKISFEKLCQGKIDFQKYIYILTEIA